MEKRAKVSAGSRKLRGRRLRLEGERADLRGRPAGEQRFRGVPFHIPSTGRSGAARPVVLSGDGRAGPPSKVTIPAGQRARRLLIARFCDLSWPSEQPLSGTVRAGELPATCRLDLRGRGAP